MKLLKARYSRQHSGFCTVLITGTLVSAVFFLNSCKKESVLSATANTEKPKVSTMMDLSGLSDDQTDAIITQFYNDVKGLQNPVATSSVNMGLTDVVFRTEGVYNKYLVQHQDSGSMYLDTFSVNLAANRDGSVNTKEAANAFWLIKDQLVQRVQTIGDPAYTLEAFDLEALSARDGSPQLVNGHYVLTIGVVLGNGGTPVPVQSPWFTTAVDHVFIAGSSYNAPQYYQSVTKGQGTINYNGGPNGQHAMVYNVNNNLPGGAESLRQRGMPYYRSMYESASGYGYWANITQVNIAGATGTATSNCDYVTRQLPGYTNLTMWKMDAPNSSDLYQAYHAWLNTAMMNFYLNFIPQYLHDVIPSGKKLYDLQIGLEGIGKPNDYHSNFHHYFVSYGNFIKINTAPGSKFSIEEL